jgi:addiction module RelE/StbE family toxin
MRIIWHKSFRRALRRVLRKNPQLEEKIFTTLELLAASPFTPSLKPHKLSGKLEGFWACSVAYDCRIVYSFERDADSDDEIILLIDIGSHDEVY